MLSLAVVVPATDGRSTQRCVAAIEAAADPPEEIIVIDEPADVGPAAARNAGARRATADIVAFVDSDIEVHPDAFQRMRSAFESEPDVVAVFGSYDDAPGGGGLVSDFRNLLHHYVHHTSAGPAATFWAGLGGIRRTALIEAGGFDQDRFPKPSVEDIELGMRLAAGGHTIVLDPTIQGKHLKPWTLAGMVRTDLFRRGAPWVGLMLEARRSSATLNLSWRHRLTAVASLILVAGVATRSTKVGIPALISILVLNGPFYLLLRRRGGWPLALTGVPLHVLHHLVGVVSVPAGLALHAHDRATRSRTPRMTDDYSV